MGRVVITGIGLITPLGHSWDDFGVRIINGDSGIKPTQLTDGDREFNIPTARIEDFDPEEELPNCKVASLGRNSHLSVFAARNALAMSGLEGGDVSGLVVGVSSPSNEVLDDGYRRLFSGSGRASPIFIPKAMTNAPVSAVSIDLGITGFSYSVASACSSANHAIINAALYIQSGHAKTVLCGASDAGLTFSNLNAWNGMRVLAQDTCRPFCKTRSGIVLGEGAVFFMLEDQQHAEKRGARILAVLDGWGQSSDSFSMTTPHVEGIERAIFGAVESANWTSEKVDYFNSHGTGTPLNDLAENDALFGVFGKPADKILVSSTKSVHGHLLGASGGIELAATLAAITRHKIPPTMNMVEKDDRINLSVVSENAENEHVKRALSASYAFGGHNTVLAVSAPM